MIYNLSRNNAFDSSKAKKDLGYKTRPFHETIRDEIAWLKEIGKLQGTNTAANFGENYIIAEAMINTVLYRFPANC